MKQFKKYLLIYLKMVTLVATLWSKKKPYEKFTMKIIYTFVENLVYELFWQMIIIMI